MRKPSQWLSASVNEAMRDLQWTAHSHSTWFRSQHVLRQSHVGSQSQGGSNVSDGEDDIDVDDGGDYHSNGGSDGMYGKGGDTQRQ